MTRARALHALAAALLLGVAATACTNAPEETGVPGRTGTPTGTPPHRPEPPVHRTTAPPAPRVVTPADDGRTVTLTPGARTQLRLPGEGRWEAPTVDGEAVDLVPVLFETDPGYQAWDLAAAHPGRAGIHAAGRGDGRRFHLTVLVTPSGGGH